MTPADRAKPPDLKKPRKCSCGHLIVNHLNFGCIHCDCICTPEFLRKEIANAD